MSLDTRWLATRKLPTHRKSRLFPRRVDNHGFPIVPLLTNTHVASLTEFKLNVLYPSPGIRVVLDYVPNHTSNESDWFVRSAKREPGFEDYYIWANGTQDAQGNQQPPNNWVSNS